MAFYSEIGNYTTSLQSQLKMARDALMAHQTQMNTVSHNVANVNTEGYHRQRAMLETRTPNGGIPGLNGNGVDVQSIERSYNSFITRQERVDQGQLGRWTGERDMMMRVEEVMNEVTDYGLGNALSQFWNSWQDLANDVDSNSARVNVVEKGQDLGRALNDSANRLNTLRNEINYQLRIDGDEINDLAKRIAALNEDIYTTVTRKQVPNDLMDQRDQLVLKLSELANISIEEDSNGSVTVYLGSDSLVMRNDYRQIEWRAEQGGGSGAQEGDLYWADSEDSRVQLAAGKVFGQLQARDTLDESLEGLNNLANTLRDEVNALHVNGIGADGTSGRNFFRDDVGGALSLQVDQRVIDNAQLVAASTVSATGDNSLAHDIFELQFEQNFEEGTSDYNDYYQSLVTAIGARVQNAETKREAAEAVLQQTQNWQQQYTGVNLDEEMSEMVQIQYAFTAATRVSATVDDLMSLIVRGFGG